MRAARLARFGGPEVLRTVDLDEPQPRAGELTIDVTHASVTLADVLLRRGDFGGEPPMVPGLEVAGRVRAVGGGVEGLAVGQPVVTLSRPTAGGYAAVSAAGAGVTIPIGDLDPAVAVVGVPNTATALVALERVARLRAGERVLVHGALGALSQVVAAVARTLGASVVDGSVRRQEQVDRAGTAGYDDVVLSGSLPDDARYDVVVDPVGGEVRRSSLAVLAPLGRVVALGNASGEDGAVDTTQLWLGSAAVAGLNAGGLFAEQADLAQEAGARAVDLVRSGAVPTAYEALPLEQAAEAHRRIEAGDVGTRLLLTPMTTKTEGDLDR